MIRRHQETSVRSLPCGLAEKKKNSCVGKHQHQHTSSIHHQCLQHLYRHHHPICTHLPHHSLQLPNNNVSNIRRSTANLPAVTRHRALINPPDTHITRHKRAPSAHTISTSMGTRPMVGPHTMVMGRVCIHRQQDLTL